MGAPLELYATRPTFVAGFIGSPAMNLIPVRLVDGRAEAAGGTVLPLPANAPTDAGDMLDGVRPQNIALAPDGSGIPATLALVEPTGEEQEVLARTATFDLQAIIRGAPALRADQSVFLSWDPDAVLLFNRATGERVR